MKAESVVASEQMRELLGIRELLAEIGVAPKLPMIFHVDKQASIKQLDGETSLL